MTSEGRERPERAAWVAVAVLWVVALLNYLDRQIVTTMGQPIKAELHIADAQFGLLSSVFLWIYGLCSPLAGAVADRWGRKPVIIGSLVIWSIATLWTGFATSFGELVLARAVMGVSEAFYLPVAVTVIVDFHRGPTRSLATGLHLSGVYAGSVLGGLGGWLAESYGWRFGFRLFGAAGVAYALLLLFMLKAPPRIAVPSAGGDPRPGDTLRTLFATRGFLVLMGVSALVGASFWTIKNWLPMYLRSEVGLDLTRAGIYGAMAFNAAAFVGMMIGATLADRWSLRNPRARALVPALGFCVGAPCFFLGGWATAVPVMIGTIVVVGMSQGFLDCNLTPALCTLAESRHRATGYGILSLVGTLTGGLMTYVGGRLKDAQVPFSTTFQGAAVLILGAGLLLFAVKPRPSFSSD